MRQLAESAPATQLRKPASLVQMAGPVAPTAPAPLNPELAAWDRAIRNSVSGYRNALVEVAYYGRRIMDTPGGWHELGYDSEDAYRDSLGLTRRTWKKYLLLGARLSHLTLAEMKSLTVQSADLLTSVHPQIWEEFAWVEEAHLLPAKEFGMLIEQRNSELGHQVIIDPKVKFTVEITKSQLAQTERRIATLRKQHRLQSAAATLNYALDAAEREKAIASKVSGLESTVAELARLWQSTQLVESAEEKEIRLDEGAISLTDAGILSRKLTRQIMRSLETLHALYPEAITASRAGSPDTATPDQEI